LASSGEAYRARARWLAERGYVVVLVHYFERTGTQSTTDLEEIKTHFLSWKATLDEALEQVRSLDNVEPQRVAVLGFSLGAYLGVSMAAMSGASRIAAVVECGGGLPAPLAPLVGLAGPMPPVLIVHGEADEVVPVAEAHKLSDLLRERKVPHEMALFANQGHVLHGAADGEAAERVVAFLGKYVGPKTVRSDKSEAPRKDTSLSPWRLPALPVQAATVRPRVLSTGPQ
jgi:carboxymethylenebutenolidase